MGLAGAACPVLHSAVMPVNGGFAPEAANRQMISLMLKRIGVLPIAANCACSIRFVDFLRTPDETLISAGMMFLVPATLLFGAVGVANSSFLKMMVCLLGVATIGIWLYRIWWWTSLL